MTDDDQRRDRILRAAFECREELVTYARALLGNYAAAEDAVQEAMLVVVAKHDQFEEGTSILAWCRSIVRIEVLRSKQRHQRERTLAQRVLDDSIDAAFDEHQLARASQERELRRDALAQCIGKVSDRGKRVLEARFVDELGYPQIGERLPSHPAALTVQGTVAQGQSRITAVHRRHRKGDPGPRRTHCPGAKSGPDACPRDPQTGRR